jgi:CDP-glucose 4,6-dehydratase
LQLVEKILKQMNSPLQPDIRNEASNEIIHQYLNADKAKNLLNWKPQFTLDEAIIQTITWYSNFLNS